MASSAVIARACAIEIFFLPDVESSSSSEVELVSPSSLVITLTAG